MQVSGSTGGLRFLPARASGGVLESDALMSRYEGSSLDEGEPSRVTPCHSGWVTDFLARRTKGVTQFQPIFDRDFPIQIGRAHV